jgi:Tol biopolymer transport system component
MFNPGSSGIYRVSAVGGEAVQVTKAVAGAHRLPIFLPDGNRFLYVSTGEVENGVVLASLDSSTKPLRFVSDLSGAQYLPPANGNSAGHVLFVRDQTLMAQPVDPTTLEPTTDLFPVTAFPVGRGQNPGDFSYSISTEGMLAYSTGDSGGDQQLIWFDRSGKQAGTVGTIARVQAFALSREGNRIVSARQRGDPSRTDLWVTESEHAPESRITFDESRNTFPVWSPDGSAVVFSSNRSRRGMLDLYLKASNGTGQDQILRIHGAKTAYELDA